jgi:hypothetical protein
MRLVKKKKNYQKMMIRICLLILFVSFQIVSFSQLIVDSIKTDADVLKFIEYFGNVKNQQWRRVSLNYKDKIFLKHTSKENIAVLDSIAKQKWVIADFNGDGQKDLIAACKIYTQFEVLGFISFENKGFTFDSCFYSLLNLSTQYSKEFPSGVYRIDSSGIPVIKLVKYHRSNPRQELRKSFRTDTLIYKISAFVEFNSKQIEPVKFDSIIFRREYVWDPQPPLLKLFSDGKFILFSKENSFESDTTYWKQGVFTGRVGQKTINILQEILGYISFNQLAATYRVNGVTDLPRFKTEFYYGGKIKKIDDYGGQGTYGLRLLYKELIRIKVWHQPEIN